MAYNLKDWIEIIKDIVLLFAGFITAIWAYSKFIAERGLLPATQFDIELGTIGVQAEKLIVELILHLKNIGTSTLVVTNLRIDVRYMDNNDKPLLFGEGDERIGRLDFPRSHRKNDIQPGNTSPNTRNPDATLDTRHSLRRHRKPKVTRGIAVVEHDTFVQPGVDQTYPFATTVPKFTSYMLVFSSFEYEVRPSRLQKPILSLSRFLGLTQYSLAHVSEAHTCERIFKLTPDDSHVP